jgi:predicted membrane metal-binding protein
MKRALSTGFMAIYWIALPFVALGTVGLAWLMLAPNQHANMVLPLGASFAVSLALTLLLVWRLWTHERARRLANERASLEAEPSRTEND